MLAVPVGAVILARRGGRRLGDWRGLFWASGQLGTTSAAATFVGTNLTFTTIFLILSEEAYVRGWIVLAVPIVWILGTATFALVYPRVRPWIAAQKTLHQSLGETFHSPQLQRWASLWTIVAFIGTVALEFFGGIRLLQWSGLGLPTYASTTLAVLLALVVVAFTIAGGLRGIALADIYLDAFLLVGTVLLFFSIGTFGSATGTPTPPVQLISDPVDDLTFVIAAAILFVPFLLCTLDTWQRLGAWKDRERKSPIPWMLPLSVLLAVAYVAPIALGVETHDRGLSVGVGSHVLKTFLDSAALPPIAIGIVTAGFLAAIFSTADELLNAAAMSFLIDTLRLPRGVVSAQPRLRLSGQFYTAIFGFVSVGIALLAIVYERQISDLAIAVFSGQVVFTWPLVIAFYRPERAQRLAPAAIAAMLVAFLVALAFVGIGWVTGETQISTAAPIASFVVSGGILGVAFWRTRSAHVGG